RVLRGAGIAVDPERLLDVVQALGYVNLGARGEVYHACRALLVHRQEQIAIFDRAFDAFWRAHHEHDTRGDGGGGAPQTSIVTIEEAGVVPEDLAALSGDDAAERESPSAETRVKT